MVCLKPGVRDLDKFIVAKESTAGLTPYLTPYRNSRKHARRSYTLEPP